MKKMVGHKQHDIKNVNHRLILEQLRHKEKLSRIELARTLSLSAPSISKNVDELIRKNVLLETGTVITSAGRRPCMVEINRDYGCVAVVDFSSEDTRIALANMRAELIDFCTVPGETWVNDAHLQKVKEQLRQMLDRQSLLRPLLNISIGTPGDIDRETGEFLYAPRFQNCSVRNFQRFFHDAFHTDVFVKNDVNLATMGENLFGAGTGCSNMLYVSVDYGIGSGMILNGKLYEGSRGFSGEIGLWIMDIKRTLEEYEKAGIPNEDVLDTRVSCFAIQRNVSHMLRDGQQSILHNWVTKAEDVTIDKIIKAYRLRDPLCVDVVKRAALQLACALKNIIDFLDIDMVILGGLSRKFGDDYLDVIRDFLDKTQPTGSPKLVWARLGHESTLYGAIGDALEYAFDQIVLQNMDGETGKR